MILHFIQDDALRVQPKVAVIYLSYYRPTSPMDIGRCFASLEQVDYPQDRWRIIDVENPSRHGSSQPLLKADWLPKAGKTLPEIELHENEKDVGYAGANVVGYEYAKAWGADYVFLLNQDTSVDPNFLTEVVAYAEAHPGEAVIQSRLMLQQEPTHLNSRGNAMQVFGFGYTLGEGQTVEEAAKSKTPVFCASGAAVLVRLSAVEKMGGLFDPRYYMYHEDTDLSWRARLAGFGIGYADKSVVFHRYEFSRSMGKFYWMERNRWVVVLSNYRLGTILVLIGPMLALELATFLFAAKSGWWKEKLKAWGFLFAPSTWAWIAERRALQKRIRRVSDASLLPLMAASVESRQVEMGPIKKLGDVVLRAFKRCVEYVVRW